MTKIRDGGRMIRCWICEKEYCSTDNKVEYVIGRDKRARYYCHDCLRKEGMQEKSFGRKEVA